MQQKNKLCQAVFQNVKAVQMLHLTLKQAFCPSKSMMPYLKKRVWGLWENNQGRMSLKLLGLLAQDFGWGGVGTPDGYIYKGIKAAENSAEVVAGKRGRSSTRNKCCSVTSKAKS